jgi:hypothetical protein
MQKFIVGVVGATLGMKEDGSQECGGDGVVGFTFFRRDLAKRLKPTRR